MSKSETVPKFGTATELAKQRGITERAIGKMIAQGKLAPALITVPGKKLPKIDLEIAHKILDSLPRSKKRGDAAPASVPDELSEGVIPNQVTSNARAAHFKAELARLELRERSGQLVDSAGVKKEAFRLARTVRDRFEAMPDRLSAILAAEPDPKKIHKFLSAEIRLALEDLTK